MRSRVGLGLGLGLDPYHATSQLAQSAAKKPEESTWLGLGLGIGLGFGFGFGLGFGRRFGLGSLAFLALALDES